MTEIMTARFLRYDRGKERTSTHLNIERLRTDGSNMDDILTRLNSLNAALNGLVNAPAAIVAFTYPAIMVPSATYAGEREAKWLIRVKDTVTGFLFANEIGCARADLPVITGGGRVYLAPTSSAYTTLKGALENGGVYSPYGNTVTLLEVEAVGRNI